jgi:hypothetical protein
MLAIDDGIASGNLNAADVFFLIAVIVAIVAAGLYAVVNPPALRWAPVALALAFASTALGLLLL